MTAARKFFENFWCTSRKFFFFLCNIQNVLQLSVITFCKKLSKKSVQYFYRQVLQNFPCSVKKFYLWSWLLHAIKNWVEAIIYSLHEFLWFTETLSRTNFYNYACIGFLREFWTKFLWVHWNIDEKNEFNCLPGLKSQSKSALNSAVSEISKISALISAVSEWVKKTSADQRCFRAVQRWFSLNQRCSALDQNELRNRRKCFV